MHSEKKRCSKKKKKKKRFPAYLPYFFSDCNLNHTYFFLFGHNDHTGLWLRTGCVTNAQVSFFERTGF